MNKIRLYLPKEMLETPLEKEFDSLEGLLSVDFVSRATLWKEYGEFQKFSITSDKTLLIAEYPKIWAVIGKLYGDMSQLELPEFGYPDIPDGYPDIARAKSQINFDLFTRGK